MEHSAGLPCGLGRRCQAPQRARCYLVSGGVLVEEAPLLVKLDDLADEGMRPALEDVVIAPIGFSEK